MIENRIRTGAVSAAFALATVVSLAGASHAEDGAVGPEIGAPAPHQFSLTDATGVEQTLSDLAGENGSVVVFVRSADWCPFCQKQLIELSGMAAEFDERGYSLVSVSTDTVDELEEFNERQDIQFTMLADPDSVAIEAFGVRDPAYDENHRAFGVPYPITFVLDESGVVTDKFYNAPGYGEQGGYRVRVDSKKVIEALDASAAS